MDGYQPGIVTRRRFLSLSVAAKCSRCDGFGDAGETARLALRWTERQPDVPRFRWQVKRRNGQKYYPPSQYVPVEVGPDGQPVFEETEEQLKQREEEEEREERERRVSAVCHLAGHGHEVD